MENVLWMIKKDPRAFQVGKFNADISGCGDINSKTLENVKLTAATTTANPAAFMHGYYSKIDLMDIKHNSADYIPSFLL